MKNILDSRAAFSADLTSVFAQVRSGIENLKQQVCLLERIDAAQKQLSRMGQKEMPPTALQIVRDQIWAAAEHIDKSQPSPDDLKASAVLLDLAEKRLVQLNDEADKEPPDTETGQTLDLRLRRLDATADPFSNIGMDLLGPAGNELRELHGVLVSRATPYRDHASFVACARLDNLTSRIQLIRDFLELFRTSAKEYRERLAREFPRLLKWLGQESWDSLTRAHGVVQQMREGVFPSDLLEALPPEIDCGPALVFPNERIQFRVKFQDPRFEVATARYDLQAVWDFGDRLSEGGWETSHYFPWRRWGWRGSQRFAAYSPTVTFKFYAPEQPGEGGKREASATPKALHVQPESLFLGLGRDRNRVEVLRFVLALLPAVFGMVAGAKEQLLKTDLMTGILGVLLLGLGPIRSRISSRRASSPPLQPLLRLPPRPRLRPLRERRGHRSRRPAIEFSAPGAARTLLREAGL